jgi:glycosyltransferase involved in cell wall biosynthesis
MNKKKRIAVIGHFGFGLDMTDGQTVKTKTITRALEQRYSEDQVLKCDTRGALRSLLLMPLLTLRMLRRADNVIILPAQRGVRITAPLLTFWNRFFHRRLHYCIVGGWLPELLGAHPSLMKRLGRFSGLYAETETMKAALEAMGFRNVYLVPNCKDLTPLGRDALQLDYQEPYRLCIFSRVMREKGIEDAVRAVESVNKAKGRTAVTLDIYGAVDPAQTEWFEGLRANFPPTVQYCGVVPYDRSVRTLCDYYALLFPTRFYTEGVPGTIIDAYAAGVPVVAARWESFADIVDDGVTGLGYPFDDPDGLADTLSILCDDPQRLAKMKADCLERSKRYLPENAMQPLFQQIGG